MPHTQQLMKLAITNTLDDKNQSEHETIKTSETDLFCAVMPDISMQPALPQSAKIIFKHIHNLTIHDGFVIVYLPSFQSILIRRYQTTENGVYLSPENKSLFKEIELPTDAVIFGQAIECRFAVNAM